MCFPLNEPNERFLRNQGNIINRTQYNLIKIPMSSRFLTRELEKSLFSISSHISYIHRLYDVVVAVAVILFIVI